MSCRGVHFAIDVEMMQRLIEAENELLIQIISEELEEPWESLWCYETDKAWDAIHRSLTDGKLEWSNGESPLNLTILGGRRLYRGDDYIVCLVVPQLVNEVAAALNTIEKDRFRDQYKQIPSDEYLELSDEDFEDTWENFSGLPGFFQRASEAERAVIFTADQ